jgi:mono/diheme cytochrome c family protein
MLRAVDRVLAVVCVAAAVLLLIGLFAGPSVIGAKKKTVYSAPAGSTPRTAAAAKLFTSSGCGGCHTLKAAGTNGSVGPNLDQVRPSATAAAAIIRSGGGPMPAFADKLSDAQISALASYIASVAGR